MEPYPDLEDVRKAVEPGDVRRVRKEIASGC
jgi:hypothetical protein